MRNRELNNGRFAMFAAVGICVAETQRTIACSLQGKDREIWGLDQNPSIVTAQGL